MQRRTDGGAVIAEQGVEKMTEVADSGCFYAVPTLRERFFRALGFRYHLGEEPPEAETLSGWMRTDIHLNFGIVDRLRLILTGRLFVAAIVQFDTPSPMVCKSRIDWRIHAPGDRHE